MQTSLPHGLHQSYCVIMWAATSYFSPSILAPFILFDHLQDNLSDSIEICSTVRTLRMMELMQNPCGVHKFVHRDFTTTNSSGSILNKRHEISAHFSRASYSLPHNPPCHPLSSSHSGKQFRIICSHPPMIKSAYIGVRPSRKGPSSPRTNHGASPLPNAASNAATLFFRSSLPSGISRSSHRDTPARRANSALEASAVEGSKGM